MGILEEMDKRIADLEALVETLQKRLEKVEARTPRPIVIPPPADGVPYSPFRWTPHDRIRTWDNSNPDPFKFTCQVDGRC